MTEPPTSPLQAERLRHLHAATAAMAHSVRPDQIALTAFEHALPALEAAAGIVALLSADGTELEIVAQRGFDALCVSWIPFPPDSPHPITDAVRRGAGVWIDSPEAYAAAYPAPQAAARRYLAWAALPLRVDGGGLGVLALAFCSPQAFDGGDREWLSTLAGQCAQALSRARLYQATAHAAERLARLQSVTGALSTATNSAQVAAVTVSQVVSGTGSAAGALLAVEPERSRLKLLASQGVAPALQAALQTVALDEPHPAADALRTGTALWLASHEAVQSAYPRFAELRAPTGLAGLAAVPIRLGGAPLAVLLLESLAPHRYRAEDRAYILALAQQCAQALDRTRLYENLESRVRERTAALEQEVAERRRVEAQLRGFSAYLNESLESERTRISRQVHDELGGALTGIKIMLKRLQSELPADAPGQSHVAWLSTYTDELVDIVRRIAGDLRPAVLDDLGLVAALEWQLEEFRKQSGLECRLNVQVGQTQVAPETGTAVFRIVKESLTNILRHAEARLVTLTIAETGASLVVTVHDDGRGLPPGQPANGGSLGFMGMRERAHLVGGTLELESPPGQGTTVRISVPRHAPMPKAAE